MKIFLTISLIIIIVLIPFIIDKYFWKKEKGINKIIALILIILIDFGTGIFILNNTEPLLYSPMSTIWLYYWSPYTAVSIIIVDFFLLFIISLKLITLKLFKRNTKYLKISLFWTLIIVFTTLITWISNLPNLSKWSLPDTYINKVWNLNFWNWNK